VNSFYQWSWDDQHLKVHFTIAGTFKIEVFSITGQLVASIANNGDDASISLNLVPGVYLVKILQGNNVSMEKMLKF
jgi:hypothetical protein